MTSPVGQVARAVRHPLSTAAYAVGLARGAVTSIARVALRDHHPQVPTQRAGSGPEVVPSFAPRPAAPQRPAAEPGESFVTEPSAVTRASEHGGGGSDREIDDWDGEVAAEDDEPEGIVEILAEGDGPGDPVDEAAMKAALSESEILRRASDPGL